MFKNNLNSELLFVLFLWTYRQILLDNRMSLRSSWRSWRTLCSLVSPLQEETSLETQHLWRTWKSPNARPKKSNKRYLSWVLYLLHLPLPVSCSKLMNQSSWLSGPPRVCRWQRPRWLRRKSMKPERVTDQLQLEPHFCTSFSMTSTRLILSTSSHWRYYIYLGQEIKLLCW